jgi:hypothetical protein
LVHDCGPKARRSFPISWAARRCPTTSSAVATLPRSGRATPRSRRSIETAQDIASPAGCGLPAADRGGRPGRGARGLHALQLDGHPGAAGVAAAAHRGCGCGRRGRRHTSAIQPLVRVRAQCRRGDVKAILPRYVTSRIWTCHAQRRGVRVGGAPAGDEVRDGQRREPHQEPTPGWRTRLARPRSPKRSARSSAAPAPLPRPSRR